MSQVGQSRSRILVAGDFAQRAGAAPLAERVPREVEEPPGGPPAARWASGALVLARCLAPGNAEVVPRASEVTNPTQHLAYALALSRSSSSGAPPVAAA